MHVSETRHESNSASTVILGVLPCCSKILSQISEEEDRPVEDLNFFGIENGLALSLDDLLPKQGDFPKSCFAIRGFAHGSCVAIFALA